MASAARDGLRRSSMSIPRLHLPMIEPEDVVRHLGKEEKHWKARRSAHALTNLWFAANALPSSVQSIFAGHPIFRSAVLIDAFFERQVDLGTAGRHSQTDLLAIVGLESQIAIVAVEGKAGESFGQYVREWRDGSAGKERRLQALCATLCISVEAAMPLRYQLLHRAASAIYEAKRYRSKLSIMLIQSFSDDDESFADFAAFLRTIGLTNDAKRGVLFGPVECDGQSFYAGWIDEKPPKKGEGLSYLDDLRLYADKLSLWCDRVRGWVDSRKQAETMRRAD